MWDLMQSLFADTEVQFTLNQSIRIWGTVDTLHKHRNEPRLSSDDTDYHPSADRLDWLLTLQFETLKYPNACIAYIEYDMTTRSGIYVPYNDEEFQKTDYFYAPDEWARMMKL
jgi:hypothetical protein